MLRKAQALLKAEATKSRWRRVELADPTTTPIPAMSSIDIPTIRTTVAIIRLHNEEVDDGDDFASG